MFEAIDFSDQVFWYLVRASGIMAVFASAASILTGLLISSRLLGPKPSVPWLTDFHRFWSSMVVFFVILHMVGLWADTFTQFEALDLLVPGKATLFGEKKWALLWGVIGFWLLVIVEWTSLLKKYLPKKVWHTFHLLSFVIFGVSLVHAYKIGSDVDNPILLSAAASVAAALLLTCLGRILRILQQRKHRILQQRKVQEQ